MKRRALLAVLALVGIGVLVFCLVPIKGVTETTTVEIEDTETYWDTENLSYEIVREWDSTQQDESSSTAHVVVKNTDNVPGMFTVHFSKKCLLWLLTGYSQTDWMTAGTDVVSLGPGEQGDATCTSPFICMFTHEITGTKQVEKQRTVIREVAVPVYKRMTLLEYVVHY